MAFISTRISPGFNRGLSMSEYSSTSELPNLVNVKAFIYLMKINVFNYGKMECAIRDNQKELSREKCPIFLITD